MGNWLGNIEEIRAHIKVCTKQNNSAMQIFTELEEVYGSNKVFYETIREKRYKDVAKYGWPITATGKSNVSKVMKIIIKVMTDTQFVILLKLWHITIAGTCQFEAYSENMKGQIQSKTICKYCYWWWNMGSLNIRTSKKN